MKTLLNITASALFAVAGLMAGIGEASADRLLTLTDEATGVTRTFSAADSSFSINGNGQAINVEVRGFGNEWSLRFEAPPGEILQPGRYNQAGCPAFFRSGRAPSLQVTNNNPLCRNFVDSIWGSFVVRQIAYDTAGAVTSLELSFTQHADSPDAPALTGLLRYDAAPLLLRVNSDAGFAWGDISQHNQGDTSLFSLTGTTAGLDYSASVIKDRWAVAIDPPTGQTLQVGRLYPIRNFADPTHAGLFITRGLGPQFCTTATGTLRIREMDTDPAGNVLNLYAVFEYHCGGAAPALRGTIRYHQ